MTSTQSLTVEPELVWLMQTAAQLRHIHDTCQNPRSTLVAVAADMEARVDAIRRRVPGKELRDACLRAAAQVFGVSEYDLLGRYRLKTLCRARHCAWRAYRELAPEATWSDIGRAFERDHSTILHGFGKPVDVEQESVTALAAVLWRDA